MKKNRVYCGKCAFFEGSSYALMLCRHCRPLVESMMFPPSHQLLYSSRCTAPSTRGFIDTYYARIERWEVSPERKNAKNNCNWFKPKGK